MKDPRTKLLIIGIGNCSRQDDGLGWAFLDAVTKMKIDGAKVLYRYQLNIEDAELISNADMVIFIDAYNGYLEEGFSFESCNPHDSFEFTTHALNPGVVLSLCHTLYQSKPEAYILKIMGVAWTLKDGLTQDGKKNLLLAISHFENSPIISKLTSIEV